MTTNRTWILRRRPVGDLRDGDLELVEAPLGELSDGYVRVRTVYLSLDPTNRIWMSDMDAYMPPVAIGEGMRGGGLGVVEESRHPNVPVGAAVNTGLATWALYNDVPGEQLSVLPELPGVPLTAFIGPLGATGMTAYFGLTDIAKPRAGETLVVSAAAGAVGSMVGQIGKIHGCRVVGIAGSDDKCRWLTETAGFDAAINFENVGGPIMDAVMARLNDFSRMPLCGLISGYNATEPTPGPYAFANLLMRRTLLKGFIVIDYLDRFPEGIEAMAGWLQQGKLHFETDIVEGLENAPASLERLFTVPARARSRPLPGDDERDVGAPLFRHPEHLLIEAGCLDPFAQVIDGKDREAREQPQRPGDRTDEAQEPVVLGEAGGTGDQDPTRPERRGEDRERGIEILDEMQQTQRQHRVVIAPRTDGFDAGGLEGHIGNTLFGGAPAGDLDHAVTEIQSPDAADIRRMQAGRTPGTAADFEHVHRRCQVPSGQRELVLVGGLVGDRRFRVALRDSVPESGVGAHGGRPCRELRGAAEHSWRGPARILRRAASGRRRSARTRGAAGDQRPSGHPLTAS